MRGFKILILSLFSLLSIYVKGQENTIKVIDYKSNETIPFAHVCFEEINNDSKYYFVTDKDGIANIPGNRELIVAISFVGYKVQIDTLKPGRDYTIKLYPKIFDIDQAVVTASFVPQKVDQSIYNVKVIDRRVIEMKAANNLSDIMADIVNVKLNQDPSLGTSLRIKGLSGNNVKILVDGVPVVGRVGGNIDISQLSLYNIDHIEMVEGPLSVIYGSNALAGAINIITKENAYSKFTSHINAYYETIGTYNFDGAISTKYKKHGFSLSGGRNFFSGIDGLDDGVAFSELDELVKPKEQYNADLYYTYTSEGQKIKYQSSYMRERLLDKGGLIAPQFYTAFDDWYISTRVSNRIDYDQDLSDSYKMNILGSYSYFQRKNDTYFKDYDLLTSKLVSEEITEFNSFLFRGIVGNSETDKKLTFITGIDFNYDIVSGDKISGDKKDIGDYALFTSLLYNLNNKVSIQPGLRYAYNSKFDVPLVPSLNVKWSALSDLVLRASYARGYRAPTIKELYIYFVDINHNIQPNEELKAEYGHNFDFTLRYHTERDSKVHYSNIELGLFYNRMHNIIDLAKRSVEGSTDPIYQNINVTNKNTLGGQLSFQYNYYPFLDFSLGMGETGIYSSLDKISSSLKDYKFSPDFSVNMSNHIQKANLTLTLSYKYTGETYIYMINENDEVDLSIRPDFHNLDFTAVSKIFAQRLTISMGVKNIFNNTTTDMLGSSGAAHTSGGSSLIGYGRYYFTKLSYNIFK